MEQGVRGVSRHRQVQARCEVEFDEADAGVEEQEAPVAGGGHLADDAAVTLARDVDAHVHGPHLGPGRGIIGENLVADGIP